MGKARRERAPLTTPIDGCEVRVVEREDAAGNWFPVSYMVRTPDGEWIEGLLSLDAVRDAIRASKAKMLLKRKQQMDLEDANEHDAADENQRSNPRF